MTETAKLFPVLSSAKVKRPTEADRRLPQWLANPTQFPAVNLHEAGQDIEEFADIIDEDIRRTLKKTMLIERLFPVQKYLIRSLQMQFESKLFKRPNDICVSSPTGSGKTLAFVIPIVNYLKKSVQRSLRCLVVLPSRDLAAQVHKTFVQVSVTTALRCAICVGDDPKSQVGLFKRLDGDLNHDEDASGTRQYSILRDEYTPKSDQGDYVSTIDVLVTTPGVLVDLLHNVPGFSLRDLEILVIDEADKLMSSHKHDWLNTVERTIYSEISDCKCKIESQSESLVLGNSKRRRVCYASICGCSMRHAHESKPIHKLLFSATLSSDPELLMQMNLFQPRLFLATKSSIVGTKIRHSLGSANSTPVGSPVPYAIPTMVNTRNELLTSTAIPEQLEEKMFIIESKEKLFVMWYLFHELNIRKVICFTNQLETSTHLCHFLNQITGVSAVEFSSNLKNEVRKKYLEEFKKDKVDVLVSTDLMARGMDVDGVEYVISYDMPVSENYYVHRCGRTARAGKKGTAITLVDTKQLVQFKKVVQLAHKMPNSMRLNDVVEEMKIPPIVKKSAEKYDLYTKVLGDYKDKLSILAKNKLYRKPEK